MNTHEAWNVYDFSGKYVGQSNASHPGIAFCQLMAVKGEVIEVSQVQIDEIEPQSFKVRAGETTYLVQRQR